MYIKTSANLHLHMYLCMICVKLYTFMDLIPYNTFTIPLAMVLILKSFTFGMKCQWKSIIQLYIRQPCSSSTFESVSDGSSPYISANLRNRGPKFDK